MARYKLCTQERESVRKQAAAATREEIEAGLAVQDQEARAAYKEYEQVKGFWVKLNAIPTLSDREKRITRVRLNEYKERYERLVAILEIWRGEWRVRNGLRRDGRMSLE